MASNRVVVDLIAKDHITNVVNGIRSSIGSSFSNIASTIGGITLGFGAAALAATNMGEGLSKAMDLETQLVADTYALSNTMGISIDEASKATKQLGLELVALGDKLPGVTEDYQKYASALSTTVATTAGGDMSKYLDGVKKASTYAGLLGVTRGVNSNQGAIAANKFISGGSSVTEAFAVADIFQRNTDFKLYLSKAQAQLGLAGKDFKKQLTNEQRLAVFNLAGSMKFTPEMIAAFGGTVDTQFQAIKSKLFNPVTGVFGFMRQIPSLDGRTTLQAVGTFVGQLDRLGSTTSKWLVAHGISYDPMAGFTQALDTISSWASAASAAMSGDNSGLNTVLGFLEKDLVSLPMQLVSYMNQMAGFLAQSITSIDGDMLGRSLKAIVSSISKAILSVRPETVSKAMGGLFNLLNKGLSAINWEQLGFSMGNFLARAMMSFDFTVLPRTIFNVVLKIADVLMGIFKGSLGAVGDKLRSMIDSINPLAPKAGSSTTYYRDNGAGTGKGFFDTPNGTLDQKALPTIGSPSKNLVSALPAFSPVISIQGGNGDLKATADYVLMELDRRFKTYKDSVLA